ncbi:MAG: helix-turn-helix domain-containing protein [Leptospira sp.]|nr:helix-turn-helix domain-containing protein [Leptospira sp.]
MEIPLDPLLRPFIKRIVIQENSLANTYKILPDTSVVIGFQLKGKIAVCEADGTTRGLATAGVTGILDKYRIFQSKPGTSSLIISFQETGAANFFREPPSEFFSQSIALSDLGSRYSEIEEKIMESPEEKRYEAINGILLSILDRKKQDLIVKSAIEKIKNPKGNLRISEIAKELNISKRQLERRFLTAVGVSPRKFSSILRFRETLGMKLIGKNFQDIVFDCGYFDQAHFINEFKYMTGLSPEKFFMDL